MQHFRNIGDRNMKNRNKKNNEESGITTRLDAIISILMNQDMIKKFNQTEKIFFLTKIGFKNEEIAAILGTTLKTVESNKYRKRKPKK